jgi:hypothetical protein
MARRTVEPPPDPFERAARRVDPQYARLAETAVPPRSLRAPRLLLMLGILVIGFAVVKGGRGAPELTRSCTTPGFAIGSTPVDVDAPLRWSVTGPAADHVLLALDSPTAVPDTPVAGPQLLTGCLAQGSFRVSAHTGKHTLTAFVVSADGSTAARLSKTFTVR